jgi:hypothetical protein
MDSMGFMEIPPGPPFGKGGVALVSTDLVKGKLRGEER